MLAFCKGDHREFGNDDHQEFDLGLDRRYEAVYFWEERNRGLSDVWDDLAGERQTLTDRVQDAPALSRDHAS